MTISQLERDLADNATARLRQWVKDTIMRCDVVDLDIKKAAAMIFTALLGGLTKVAAELDIDENEFMSIVRMSYRWAVEEERNRRKSEKSVDISTQGD